MDKELQFPIPAYVIIFFPMEIGLYEGQVVGKDERGMLYTTSRLLWMSAPRATMQTLRPTPVKDYVKIVYDLGSAVTFIQQLHETMRANHLADLQQNENKISRLIGELYRTQQDRYFKHELLNQLNSVTIPTIKDLYEQL
ncbi:MAG TPA: hypothetical protein VI423_10850 [Paenisporosarcina sp.]|nr:hypothetical protein [Paenisporosarcina sp.]